MSSKGTIFLSKDDEHWYHETMDDTVELEINLENMDDFWFDEATNSISITIKADCDLRRYIYNHYCNSKERNESYRKNYSNINKNIKSALEKFLLNKKGE